MLPITKFSLLLLCLNVIFVNAQNKTDKVTEDVAAKPSCSIDLRKDASKSQMVYLQNKMMRFRYPMGYKFNAEYDQHIMRIGCPGGYIQLKGNVTTYKTAQLDCMHDSMVKIAGTSLSGNFSQFKCSGYEPPVSRFTSRRTPTGKYIAEIGYPMGKFEFLPVIDEVAISQNFHGFVPSWAHYFMMNPTAMDSSYGKDMKMMKGPLSMSIDYQMAYNWTMQREMFKNMFGEEMTSFIMPTKGNQGFVPAKLVNPEDFYYEIQRNATYYYELSSPVWNSVAEGNWKLSGKLVRDLAHQRKHLEVYSGTYLHLYLYNQYGSINYIRLPEDLRPAQFLFKMVIDKATKQGVVLITVNNPFLKEADRWNVICPAVKECAAAYQSSFVDFHKGYTYCCNLADFKIQASRMGLPVKMFEDYSYLKM